MNYAFATKDQMKVWKSAAALLKGDPERSVNQVMLHIRSAGSGFTAHLLATDGYQLMKRNINTEDLFEGTFPQEYSSAIPRSTVEKAEKAMKQGDHAYFGENRITLKSPVYNERNELTDYKVFAELPYIEQLDMFKDFESALEKGVKSDVVSRKVLLNAHYIKLIADQLRSDDSRVTVELSIHGGTDVVTFKAFPDDENLTITAGIMPIKG